MIEHHIQKEIISRLSRAVSLRFSELRPKDVESNLFIYHLKHLIAQKYVLKTDDGYCLDVLGMTYVDGLSFAKTKPRKQPKILSILSIKNNEGQYLLAKRKLQPFIGTYLFPGGKQHFGESAETHIAREVTEQFDVSASVMRRGMIDQRNYIDGRVVTHILGHVYQVEYSGNPPAESNKFVYEWKHLEDKADLYPGTYQLFTKLENEKGLFFLSLDVETNKSYT